MASNAKLREVPPLIDAAPTLASAMASAFAEIEGATKSAKNPHFKSKYADITAVIEAIKPALINHGLYFTQRPEPSEHGVTVETVIGHMNGEELSLGKLFVPANKNDAQGFGSALTYARRYALVTAFGVPTEDDDGNAAAKTSPLRQQLEQGVEQGKQPAHSALKTELRQFVRELESCGDWDTYAAFRETPEYKRMTSECEAKLPAWWDGGEEMPAEFVPLRRRIEILEANLAESKAEIATA
jgi:hypothetical protein